MEPCLITFCLTALAPIGSHLFSLVTTLQETTWARATLTFLLRGTWCATLVLRGALPNTWWVAILSGTWWTLLSGNKKGLLAQRNLFSYYVDLVLNLKFFTVKWLITHYIYFNKYWICIWKHLCLFYLYVCVMCREEGVTHVSQYMCGCQRTNLMEPVLSFYLHMGPRD